MYILKRYRGFYNYILHIYVLYNSILVQCIKRQYYPCNISGIRRLSTYFFISLFNPVKCYLFVLIFFFAQLACEFAWICKLSVINTFKDMHSKI